MDEFVIVPIQSDDYIDCAKLHIKLLQEGVLHLLGYRFLAGLYYKILNDPNIYGWVAMIDTDVVGSIVVNKKPKNFIVKMVLKNPVYFGLYFIKAIFAKPNIVPKLCSYFKYSNEANDDYGMHDILFLGVYEEQEGKGIGSKLLEVTCNSSKNDISVCTTKDNKKAIGLYNKFGFEIKGEYCQSGMRWVSLKKQRILLKG